MIVGAHVVVASKDADADHEFFRDVLKLNSVDAGGGYMIIGLPASEASIHASDGEVPHHELYFLCDDVSEFVAEKLPSGAPLHVYQPRHARPSDAS